MRRITGLLVGVAAALLAAAPATAEPVKIDSEGAVCQLLGSGYSQGEVAGELDTRFAALESATGQELSLSDWADYVEGVAASC